MRSGITVELTEPVTIQYENNSSLGSIALDFEGEGELTVLCPLRALPKLSEVIRQAEADHPELTRDAGILE